MFAHDHVRTRNHVYTYCRLSRGRVMSVGSVHIVSVALIECLGVSLATMLCPPSRSRLHENACGHNTNTAYLGHTWQLRVRLQQASTC